MNIVQAGQLLRPVTEASTARGLSRMRDMADMLQRRTGQNKQDPHHFEVGCGVLTEGSPSDELGVWTLSTLWVSDRVVCGSDRAGFRLFPRESSVCGGWNAVRVPPRARIFPGQGAVGPLTVHKFLL
jgi:hypothetical protein